MSSVRNTSNTYSDYLYSNPLGTRQNNCYAWAINQYRNSGDEKLQPGDLAKMSGGVDLSNCDDLVKRALADAKSQGWTLQYIGNASEPCGPGSYKIVAVLAPNRDFHWYRQHRDLLYRVKTERTIADLAREFQVPTSQISVPNVNATTVRVGDVVLIKNANVWSHKQGFSGNGPLLKDACGKIIKDPWKACRNYGRDLDYTTICGAFCFRK